MNLASESCIPCRGGIPPLDSSQCRELVKGLDNWTLQDNQKITKVFTYEGFIKGIELANTIAQLAENEGHHPDLHIYWGKLEIELWTHKIGGLSRSDFILAAKIDQAL
jgi:4a-hydroxytetrahydrobiopterin dehydratase